MSNTFLVIGVMLVVTHSSMSDTIPMGKYAFEVDSRDAKHTVTSKNAKANATYTVEDKMIGDLNTKVLMNTLTGEYVQIITDLGGRIEDLVLQGSDGKLRSVLLTHDNNVTAIKENAYWKNAILLPYANRIDGVSWPVIYAPAAYRLY